MIAISDYDAGKGKSVEKAFISLGQEAVITRDHGQILAADRVVLPGVGNFGDAMGNLGKYEMVDVIHSVLERKTPFLGICVGMQLLFEGSEESPGTPGLGILRGSCHRFKEQPGMKVPQIGWNSLSLQNREGLFRGIADGAYVYFVHSYYVKARDEEVVAAYCDYGTMFHAAVQKENLWATQFHPEKSGDLGLAILKNFCAFSGDSGKKSC